MAENDYCYMFEYYNVDSFPATIYVHYFPMSFLVDEVSELVRIFYGDSVFCSYYNADVSDEESFVFQPLHIQQLIDSVLRSLDISDTVILGGNDDLYAWEEIRVNNKIVVGYFNVPVQKRKLFNKALFSLRKEDCTSSIDEYRKEMMEEGY